MPLESLSRHLFPLAKDVVGVVIIVPINDDVREFLFEKEVRGFINIPTNEFPSLSPSEIADKFRNENFNGCSLMPCYCETLEVPSKVIGGSSKKVQNFCFLLSLNKDTVMPSKIGIIDAVEVKNGINNKVMQNMITAAR